MYKSIDLTRELCKFKDDGLRKLIANKVGTCRFLKAVGCREELQVINLVIFDLL